MAMKTNFEYLGTPSGILKIFEIVFVIIAFGIFRGTPIDFAYDNATYFGCGVLVSCLIITPLLLVCYLMGKTEIQESILEITLNFLFFIFLLSVSIASFIYWKGVNKTIEGRSSGLALATFTLMASVTYLVDVPFAVKNYRDHYYGGGGGGI